MSVERATFAGRWAEAVAARGSDPFLLFLGADGRTTEWTYAEFDHLVDRVSGRLVASGVGHGSAVHLALRSSPAFVATWLAVTRLGAWMVPSDPEATSAELAEHLRRTRPVVGVYGAERAETYRAAVAQAGADAADSVPLTAIAVDEDDPGPADLLGDPSRSGSVSWTSPDSETSSTQNGEPQPRPHDRLAVMFTSGTTSAPKGVELTQANYAYAGDVMAAAAALRPDDRQLVVLPLFHANAQYYSFASAISVGASVALVHRFSASGFLVQASVLQATCASLFAAPIRMVLASGATPVEGTRLRHCWYAQNLTRDQYDQFAGLVGCRPRQLYGMTETLPAVVTDRPLDPRPDAMGYPTLGCEVRVVDGELHVRGVPGETLFAGYLDDPDTTKASIETLADGSMWFTTGDRARVDHDGRLVFAGRRSDVLKVAGENVSTVEVEAVLSEHPAVLEAAVVGRPDPVRDEVPVAFVVLTSRYRFGPGREGSGLESLSTGAAGHGDTVSSGAAAGREQAMAGGTVPTATDVAAELLTFTAERLAKAKRPREVHIVDELPRTSVGKIRKFLLPGGDP
ncbi:MAG: class I adenylate-forming enzyme family protein [Acidimicrobiales bacterium]